MVAKEKTESKTRVAPGDDKSGRATTDLPEDKLVAVGLKNAREAKGLTFSDLHRLTGISRTTLHDYESGRSVPGGRELMRLSYALGASPNRLLFGMTDPFADRGPVATLVQTAKVKPGVTMVGLGVAIPLIISRLSGDSLVATATLLDELLRARDPELFEDLCKLIPTFDQIELDELKTLSPEQQQATMGKLMREALMPKAGK